ncbi:hypothetical protein PN466_13730 [Roseofilum reptotaenium CS-1145]|uniref:Uncharacterized protein n=1 Tax=Roseofilum reptotaenium AO1-A TaxID=1925591 RepID=A0A1L9QWC8_9CYAN|nr:hypothetical protein [Roseofilum reptotaenium]MDB9518007.1 hypothetical protein [Roseofilum reptotaenium CS-1145]OJJ26907.1 hypothetical protein BI308_04235 [Roseofilum reptotaenium AO1-A]
MSDLFNFKDDFSVSHQKMSGIHHDFNALRQIQQQESKHLERLKKDMQDIADILGVSVDEISSNNSPKSPPLKSASWDDQFFLNNPLVTLEERAKQEVLKKPNLLPPLSQLDYAVVGITGLVATLLDFFVVAIPKDINYLGKYQQKGSQFTRWLRTLGMDNGKLHPFLKWCEKVCKVPYDKSISSDIPGLTPKNHRLLSLGHDPLFGLIFGMFDILNGSLTAFDVQGNLKVIKTWNRVGENKIFAPLIWLGHIVSDLCTSMGVPIPGWGFTQLLQFGSIGPKNMRIAQTANWMYVNGYELRHLLTLSMPVAAIDLVIRSYHYFSILKPEPSELKASMGYGEIEKIQANLKLNKMLLLSRAIAVSGNGLKVFTYTGNPLAVNLTQWLFLIKDSVAVVQGMMRDKAPEQLVRNRQQINLTWQDILG